MPQLALLFGTFALMWFLLIRPQQRRVRAHQAVVSAVQVGDEVVTAGGLYGTVLSVDDDSITLEAAPGVNLRFMRAAINRRLTAAPEDEA